MNGRMLVLGVLMLTITAGAIATASAMSRSPVETEPIEEDSLDDAVAIARDFLLRYSPTYRWDGVPESPLTVHLGPVVKHSENRYEVMVSFRSTHGGYGDRTGQVVTEAITDHVMTVVVEEGKVVSAVIDGAWDELAQRPVQISLQKPL